MSQLREQAVKCVKRAWSFAKRQSLKLVVGAGLFALSTGTALANSKGAGGFSKATTEISSYQTPDEGHCSRHRTRGCVQCVFQNAERRPGCKKVHHAHHRWLCGFHRHVGGTSALLQVTIHR